MIEINKKFILKPIPDVFICEQIENLGFINICKCNNHGLPHIHTKDGSKKAEVGMWVVENKKHEIYLLSNETFNSLYQPYIPEVK